MQKMQQGYTFNFLEVVWQHVLGVMGNVVYYFVGNFTNFPVVKEAWNQLRFNEIIDTIARHVFWDTMY